jgi:nucleotide-binding universal stress UspA family protein
VIPGFILNFARPAVLMHIKFAAKICGGSRRQANRPDFDAGQIARCLLLYHSMCIPRMCLKKGGIACFSSLLALIYLTSRTSIMYTTILVPVDGSPTSDCAIAEAAKLAVICSARVRLLHVLDMAAYSNGFEQAEVYVSQIRPLALAAAEDWLARGRAILEAAKVPVDTELRESVGGRVATIIVERAAAWGADVIVMGTHGRRGLERLMMGSDAELVVRTSPVPVLLVKSA